MTEPASHAGCEVWLRRPRFEEAGALAMMIAPLLDRDADELEVALRAGPVQAARDLPLSEATQLAEVLMGFGAAAEVRSGPTSEPPVLNRGTRPFDATALRASLAERGDEVRSLPPARDTLPTPPVPSQPPVLERPRAIEPMPPIRPTEPLRGTSRPDVTGEPTQVSPLDDELIRAAIAAAEAAERETPRGRSLPPASEVPRERPATPTARTSQPGREPVSRPPASRPPISQPVSRPISRPVSQPVSRPPTDPPRAAPAPSRPAEPAARPTPAVMSTGEGAALKGRVTLPKSLQSRDDLPPWFPKVPLRPEAAPPARSRLPILLFAAGVVALVAAVVFVVLQG